MNEPAEPEIPTDLDSDDDHVLRGQKRAASPSPPNPR